MQTVPLIWMASPGRRGTLLCKTLIWAPYPRTWRLCSEHRAVGQTKIINMTNFLFWTMKFTLRIRGIICKRYQHKYTFLPHKTSDASLTQKFRRISNGCGNLLNLMPLSLMINGLYWYCAFLTNQDTQGRLHYNLCSMHIFTLIGLVVFRGHINKL